MTSACFQNSNPSFAITRIDAVVRRVDHAQHLAAEVSAASARHARPGLGRVAPPRPSGTRRYPNSNRDGAFELEPGDARVTGDDAARRPLDHRLYLNGTSPAAVTSILSKRGVRGRQVVHAVRGTP